VGETTNVPELIRDLNAALELQYRCAIGFAVAAGTLPGPEGVGLSERLRGWAADELVDVERIAARVASLGGEPVVSLGEIKAPMTWKQGMRALIDAQRQALDAFVNAIPAKADDREGEATEHLLEHVIHRKRDVLEVLERAVR
jgi:bacterioferritin (cytochrome b1)